MPGALEHLACQLLLDGEELRNRQTTRRAYYRQISVPESTGEGAGLGIKRLDDPVRALITSRGRASGQAAIALGPSAGLVLGVSLGTTSIRAAIVDANGWIYNEHRGESLPGQLAAAPADLFDRIKHAGDAVLTPSLADSRLLVAGTLPFLGIAVAWPVPLDRDKVPRSALSHREWHASMSGINERLARHLHIPVERSHAINDAAAAALAVAFDHTRAPSYKQQAHAELLLVVRVAGGIGTGTIAVEQGNDGGWMESRLGGGRDHLAGEIGHTPVNAALVAERNESRPADCPELAPVRCSCARKGEPPGHVEAYASSQALGVRFLKADDRTIYDAIERVLANPTDEAHKHALDDVGVLVGDCLLPSILMLNPNRITLTGQLATPEVRSALEEHLESSKPLVRLLGVLPEIRALSGPEHDFIGVRGAALTVLRTLVHRRFGDLYGAPQNLVAQRFAELTIPLTKAPWSGTR
jgi:predicted NBD/HSP70 family sugar kinase